MIQSRSLGECFESSSLSCALFFSLCINCGRRPVSENLPAEYPKCGRCLIIPNEQQELVKKREADVANSFNIGTLLPPCPVESQYPFSNKLFPNMLSTKILITFIFLNFSFKLVRLSFFSSFFFATENHFFYYLEDRS